MKSFAISAALVISTVSYSSVASANSRVALAGTTGQSAMQSLNAEQKAQSIEQTQPQSRPEPNQTFPMISTQQDDNVNYKATCLLRSVTAGGQAKVAIAAVQSCRSTTP